MNRKSSVGELTNYLVRRGEDDLGYAAWELLDILNDDISEGVYDGVPASFRVAAADALAKVKHEAVLDDLRAFVSDAVYGEEQPEEVVVAAIEAIGHILGFLFRSLDTD